MYLVVGKTGFLYSKFDFFRKPVFRISKPSTIIFYIKVFHFLKTGFHQHEDLKSVQTGLF
jgi:hypothetical protein